MLVFAIIILLSYLLINKNTSMIDKQVGNGFKEFTFPNESFVFQYPEFKAWSVQEIKKIDNNHYIIYLDYPSDKIFFEIQPQIYVTKVPEWRVTILKSKGRYVTKKTNPNDVLYDRIKIQHEPEMLAFFGDDFGVTITPISTNDEYGFHTEEFFEEIIKTFKFVQVNDK